MHEPVAAALRLTVDGPLHGGEHGAFAVRDDAGEPHVLKVFGRERTARVETAAAMTGHLRAVGAAVPWPYLAGTVGDRCYTRQGWVDGVVPRPLDDRAAAFLLEQWSARRGVAPYAADWPSEVDRALRRGSAFFYAEHAPIRAAGGYAAALLDEIVSVADVGAAAVAALRGDDIVHGDYHHENLLVDDRRAIIVIDWEDATPGDGRYDLVNLDYWAQVFAGTEVDRDAATRIRTAIDAEDAAVVAVLRALFALHQLWFVAARRPERLARCVENVERHLAPAWRHRLIG